MKLDNEIKIAFFDFDWTLFDHRTYEIKPSTIKAIKKLKEKNIKVVINTGSSYYSLFDKDIVKELNPDAVVVANGGAARVDDKILYAHFFDEEMQDSLIKFFNANKYSYGIISLYTTYGKTFERGNVDKFFNSFCRRSAPFFVIGTFCIWSIRFSNCAIVPLLFVVVVEVVVTFEKQAISTPHFQCII